MKLTFRDELPPGHIEEFIEYVKRHNWMWTQAMKYMPTTSPSKINKPKQKSKNQVRKDMANAVKNKQINKFFKFK